VWIASQIDGLLLGGAGHEVDGTVEPHGNEGSDMWSTIGSDRRDPEQLGRLTVVVRRCGLSGVVWVPRAMALGGGDAIPNVSGVGRESGAGRRGV
jgi:hypothetical protein